MARTNATSRTWTRKDGSKYKPSTPWSKAKAAARVSKEWDLRVDVGSTWSLTDVINNLSMSISRIQYAFVSTVEGSDIMLPTEGRGGGSRSETTHVHIGLIMMEPCLRGSIIAMCLRRKVEDLPTGSVYCVPRNTNYSYGGWLAHHTKDFTKLEPSLTNLAWEFGSMPKEDFSKVNDQQLARWLNVINRYATPYWKERLAHYAEQAELRTLDREEQQDATSVESMSNEPPVHPSYNITTK